MRLRLKADGRVVEVRDGQEFPVQPAPIEAAAVTPPAETGSLAVRDLRRRACLTQMEFAAKQAPELGMTALGIEVIPPPTPDYTPFATKLKDAGANWVFSWAPPCPSGLTVRPAGCGWLSTWPPPGSSWWPDSGARTHPSTSRLPGASCRRSRAPIRHGKEPSRHDRAVWPL